MGMSFDVNDANITAEDNDDNSADPIAKPKMIMKPKVKSPLAKLEEAIKKL